MLSSLYRSALVAIIWQNAWYCYNFSTGKNNVQLNPDKSDAVLLQHSRVSVVWAYHHQYWLQAAASLYQTKQKLLVWWSTVHWIWKPFERHCQEKQRPPSGLMTHLLWTVIRPGQHSLCVHVSPASSDKPLDFLVAVLCYKACWLHQPDYILSL